MSYRNRFHTGSQTQECEMSADPDPQNTFWAFVQNYIYHDNCDDSLTEAPKIPVECVL